MKTDEVWILGATGRIGRAVATRLTERGITPVLVGRDHGRTLAAAPEAPASGTGDARATRADAFRVVVAPGPEAIAAEIDDQRPAVAVNTIGDYARTAPMITAACLRVGAHYLDVANDLTALPTTIALHDEAEAAGSTLITGAGFGVLATEAVVAKLCAGRDIPSRIRVDALASVATEPGVVGEALAATIVDVMTSGGRRFTGGNLVRSRLGAGPLKLTTPDGAIVASAEVPSGELFAARSAGRAPDIVVTSALAPANPAVRALLPALARLLAIPALRRFALTRLAGAPTKAAPRPRPHSWGHAVVIWPDGTGAEGWLRAGDGMDFTAAVLAESAARLLAGDAKPGAYTPAAAFGPDLAEAAGATFIL